MGNTKILTLPAAGAIALLAVSDAIANIGVHEVGGENRGKYVETYLASVGLGPGNPWCAAHVYYRESQAAIKLGKALPADFPKSGYCPDFQNWAKKNGLWISIEDAKANPSLIKRGDLCLFYFSAKGRVAHIGIVTGSITGGVATVEGNTSDGSGVDRDGDGIYERHRAWSAFGSGGGFVRLPF